MNIKKTICLMALALVFSHPVMASHHRGHALGFIDTLETQLDLAEDKAADYVNAVAVSGCTLNSKQQQSVDVIFRYSGFLHGNMDQVREILNDPNGDLDAARRKINQPNSSNPGSASILVRGLLHRSRMLITACPAANVHLAGVIQRLTLVWSALDRVIWHVTDATREEKYLDPEFAE